MLIKNKLKVMAKVYHSSSVDEHCWRQFVRANYSQRKTCFSCKCFGTEVIFAKKRKRLVSKNPILDKAFYYLVKYARKIRRLLPHKQRKPLDHCW